MLGLESSWESQQALRGLSSVRCNGSSPSLGHQYITFFGAGSLHSLSSFIGSKWDHVHTKWRMLADHRMMEPAPMLCNLSYARSPIDCSDVLLGWTSNVIYQVSVVSGQPLKVQLEIVQIKPPVFGSAHV